MKRLKLNSNFLTLDTETSHLGNKSWIYQFGVCFGTYSIYGKNPFQLNKVLSNYLFEREDKTIIFVHNLSYDICFLLKFLREKFGKEENTICLKSRKVLSISWVNFELRCSYLLTNKSLSLLTEQYNVIHNKLSGYVDYTKVRYQDSKLELDDDLYMLNDIVGLHEIIRFLVSEKGSLKDLPLTSTGYVRTFCRQQAKLTKSNRERFKNTRLTVEQYIKVNKAYKGGYCHCNYKYRNRLIRANIGHYDFESHYPTTMMLEKYPMGPFHNVGKLSRNEIEYYSDTHKILLTILVSECKLKDDKYFSYIPTVNAPCTAINDNGRVYKCDELFELCITYEDLLIIESQYHIDYKILDVEIAKADYLPDFIRNSIKEFFTNKTLLKDKVRLAKKEKNITQEYFYSNELMKNKSLLNSLSGMCATNPVRNEFEIDEYGLFIEHPVTDIGEVLDKYYKSRNNFLPYQWGIWVTAYGRKYLFDVFNLIGQENVLYCDTDSAFFIKQKDTIAKLKQYNDILFQKAKKSNSCTFINDELKYFGKFDDEKENIIGFKALHSKCYLFETDDNLLHSVIAGVKQAYVDDNGILHFNTEELDSFDKFKHDFTFSKNFGGTTSKYLSYDITYESIDGHMTYYADGIIIEEIEKTLNNNFERI